MSKNLSLLLVVLLMLTSCGEKKQPATTEPVKEVKEFKRIVSLAPSSTEILYAIGAGDKVVGVTKFCLYPEEAQKCTKVGGYFDISYEVIYSLQPDLVIILKEHEDAKVRLAELKIPTLELDTSSIDSIYTSIIKAGEKLNKSKEAETCVADIKGKLKALSDKIANVKQRRVMISIGRNMGTGGLSDVYIAGKKTMYDEMLQMLNASNVYDSGNDYAKLSQEGIMQLNPDVILDLVPDLETSLKMTREEVLKDWQVIPEVTAVKNNQVTILSAPYVVVPGPRIVLTMQDIAQAIYPEEFAE